MAKRLPVPDYIDSLRPYQPGKPIEETKREFGLKEVFKLASNENPLGGSPKAMKAVKQSLKESHRYPDGSAYVLKNKIAKIEGIQPEQVLVGNGSNEIIDFLVRAYCRTGEKILTSQAAFIAYKLCAQIHGVETLEAPLTSDLRFDLDRIKEMLLADKKIRLVFIPNPNNPTGTYLTETELLSFLDSVQERCDGKTLIVLDYAYWEYVTEKSIPDPTELGRRYSSLVVLRTFSKVYGLAALRIGYVISDPQIIQTLEKIRQPFNVNSLALDAAVAALDDKKFVKESRKVNAKGLKLWEATMKSWGARVLPSQGNFFLAETKESLGMTGVEIFELCLPKGVILRPVVGYGLPDWIRISIGTETENRKAIKIMAKLLGKELPSVLAKKGKSKPKKKSATQAKSKWKPPVRVAKKNAERSYIQV